MDLMENIYRQAQQEPQRVIFPEAENEKMQQAARECTDRGICRAILLGDPQKITASAAERGISLDGIEIADAFDAGQLDQVIESYSRLHPDKQETVLREMSRDPLYTALMMKALGQADVVFAGIDHTTGSVISAGLKLVGLRAGIARVSSVAVFKIPAFGGSEEQLLGFADSAVNLDPDAEQLAGIAISSCDTLHDLLDWDVRCALLSYSTDGSAGGDTVTKVREAVRIANERRPDLAIDGEFQLDAAIDPAVAAKKVKRESRVAGRANVIIFPDLNAGNIGVKLMQQFAHADAYGPMLQGFDRIVCDCSRGALVEEIVGNVAMSCVRAQKRR